MNKCLAITTVALLGFSATVLADATALSADQAAFRALCKELVETNSTLSSGSCTLAAERMAAHAAATRHG